MNVIPGPNKTARNKAIILNVPEQNLKQTKRRATREQKIAPDKMSTPGTVH